MTFFTLIGYFSIAYAAYKFIVSETFDRLCRNFMNKVKEGIHEIKELVMYKYDDCRGMHTFIMDSNGNIKRYTNK